MKKKYRIGLCIATFAAVLLLCLADQVSYHYASEREQARSDSPLQAETNPKIKADTEDDSISTKGAAEKTESYYLMNLHGYVTVYYEDKYTIYELTEIPVDSLPAEVQGELLNGKYIETTEELYAFLQNYSS